MPKRDSVKRLLIDAHALPRAHPALERALDLAIAAVALALVGPFMVIVALAILAERRGPVLFAHPRLGRGAKMFNVLKFRSMVEDGDAILQRHLQTDPLAAAEWLRDHKLRCDPRVTRLGSFLRRSSLDELPQLFNVLRGEMSIVGPRPIIPAEVSRYGRFFKAYCSVRPGITGVWQVSGRSDVSYRRRVAMDAVYARRKSVVLDLEIMLATIPAVILRKGSY